MMLIKTDKRLVYNYECENCNGDNILEFKGIEILDGKGIIHNASLTCYLCMDCGRINIHSFSVLMYSVN